MKKSIFLLFLFLLVGCNPKPVDVYNTCVDAGNVGSGAQISLDNALERYPKNQRVSEFDEVPGHIPDLESKIKQFDEKNISDNPDDQELIKATSTYNKTVLKFLKNDYMPFHKELNAKTINQANLDAQAQKMLEAYHTVEEAWTTYDGIAEAYQKKNNIK